MTKRRHVAFINVSGPSHVNPTIPIVETLVRRGVRVTYVTPQRHASEIADLGAEVLLCPRLEPPYREEDNEAGTLPIERQNARDHLDLASRTAAATLPFYRDNVPSVIVSDASAFAGQLLSGKLGVALIRMTPSLPFDEQNLHHPAMPAMYRESVMTSAQRLDGLLAEHGVLSQGAMFLKDSPAILFYERSFELSPAAGGDSRIYAGRCAAERLLRQRWQPRSPRPAILVSTSTMFLQGVSYYAMCAEALAGSPYHTILTVGTNLDPATVELQSEQCEVTQSSQLSAIMPFAEMIICMGAMTTTMEAMYHGLPMLMLTQGNVQQEMYAQNVENHGLGVHLKAQHTSIESIRDHALRMMTDGALRATVKRMQKAIRASAGAEEVCNWLEDHMDEC